MRYTLSFRDTEGFIIVDKKYNTRQERDEEYQSLQDEAIGHKVLLKNDWYVTRYFRKVGDDYIVGVSR